MKSSKVFKKKEARVTQVNTGGYKKHVSKISHSSPLSHSEADRKCQGTPCPRQSHDVTFSVSEIVKWNHRGGYDLEAPRLHQKVDKSLIDTRKYPSGFSYLKKEARPASPIVFREKLAA